MDNLYKLMRKEFIFFKGTMHMQFIISLLFVTVFPLISTNFVFLGSMIVPYFAIYGVMAYEEKSRGEILIVTLPVSRKEICLSKYLLGIVYVVVGIGMSMGCLALGEMIFPHDAFRTLILSNIVGFSMLMLAMGISYIAVMLPVLFKFGTEKSRYVMLLLYVGIFTLSSAFGGIIEEVGVLDGITEEIGKIGLLDTVEGVFVGIGLLGVVLYILSIGLSIKIMTRKEF